MTDTPSNTALTPLLGPHEPPPHEVINADGQSRLLLVCEHASNRVPESLNQLGLSPSALERHIGWDVNAVEVAKTLSAHFDSRLVVANYSRLVTDLNRSVNDRNCFREKSESLRVPGNQNMTAEQKNQRIEALFKPFHQAVNHEINRFFVHQISPVLISIHSFTPVYKIHHRTEQIGILWDKSERLAVPLIQALKRNKHLVVGDNLPYSGKHPEDYTIDVHGESANLACLGIEIRQDLIANPEGIERFSGLLIDALSDVLKDENLYQPQQGAAHDQAAV